jgi:hypothetical protein
LRTDAAVWNRPVQRQRLKQLSALAQKCWDVTGALGNCDDLDPLAPGAVKDKICPDRPEEDRKVSKVLAGVTEAGSLGERLEASNSFSIQRSAASMLSSAMYSQISLRSCSASTLSTYLVTR